jgi:hypothetical protein
MPRHAWNTLQILKVGRAVLLVAVALELIAMIAGIRIHRSAMQTIGKDSAPSIIAAQHIKSALADMDANAANELLAAPGAGAEAIKAYETRRIEAAKALIAAAENITYGDAERVPIQSLQVGMGTYERLIQRARDLHDRPDRGNEQQFIAAYLQAAQLMDTQLLPAADALDKANNDVLESTYKRQTGRSWTTRVICICAAGLLLLALAGVQLFLVERTRRVLNPLLAAATLLLLGTAVYVDHALATEQHALKVARQDAFISMHALWQARAIAYWANGDESRYLADPANHAQYEMDFFAKSRRLANLPSGMTFDETANTARSGHAVPGFTGYLADELNNITFKGERDAAIETLLRFGQYLAVDQQIRLLEKTGKHHEAIELCVGVQPGQSDWAFERFDQALGATLAINQDAFDRAVAQGLDAMQGLEVKAAILAAVSAILIFLGLAVRIREYE